MMQIVLLDTNRLPKNMAATIANRFSQFGEYKSYPSTTIDNIVEHAYDAEVILTNKTELTAAHFKLLPNLKYVIVIATGYDCVDVKAVDNLNIPISNIPSYCSEIVAQHTIALLLELTNKVGESSNIVKNEHKWLGIRCYNVQLSDLSIGLVGFGDIAQRVIAVAIAFGMKVLVHSRKASYNTDLPVKFVSREELFCHSDVITLHCPCTEETKYIINQGSLALMKPSAYLINTSRGGLVNETALVAALVSGQIAGAALDVLEVEPPLTDNPLFKLGNCIITPHSAWLSDNALQNWIDIMQENMIGYLQGKLINLI
jgi:glycerate dehydrogenase